MFEHRNGFSCSEMEDELDDANAGITEQANLKLAALDKVDALMAERDSLRQRGDDYAVEGIRVLERAERAEAERDELRYDLTVLREAWNKHFLSCPSGLSEIVPPTAEQVREWLNAPSDTASGAGEAG